MKDCVFPVSQRLFVECVGWLLVNANSLLFENSLVPSKTHPVSMSGFWHLAASGTHSITVLLCLQMSNHDRKYHWANAKCSRHFCEAPRKGIFRLSLRQNPNERFSPPSICIVGYFAIVGRQDGSRSCGGTRMRILDGCYCEDVHQRIASRLAEWCDSSVVGCSRRLRRGFQPRNCQIGYPRVPIESVPTSTTIGSAPKTISVAYIAGEG